MDISFEGGALLDPVSGYQLAASSTGLVDAGHVLVKRQAEIVLAIAAATAACMTSGGGSVWTQSLASPVTCPELGDWPAFQELTNIDADTQCWEGVVPSFRLYERNHKTTLASQASHLLSLPTGVQANEIAHLAIVIHGYKANAQIGRWPDQMADLIIEHDPKVDAVLTVDWERGAFPPTIRYHWTNMGMTTWMNSESSKGLSKPGLDGLLVSRATCPLPKTARTSVRYLLLKAIFESGPSTSASISP